MNIYIYIYIFTWYYLHIAKHRNRRNFLGWTQLLLTHTKTGCKANRPQPLLQLSLSHPSPSLCRTCLSRSSPVGAVGDFDFYFLNINSSLLEVDGGWWVIFLLVGLIVDFIFQKPCSGDNSARHPETVATKNIYCCSVQRLENLRRHTCWHLLPASDLESWMTSFRRPLEAGLGMKLENVRKLHSTKSRCVPFTGWFLSCRWPRLQFTKMRSWRMKVPRGSVIHRFFEKWLLAAWHVHCNKAWYLGSQRNWVFLQRTKRMLLGGILSHFDRKLGPQSATWARCPTLFDLPTVKTFSPNNFWGHANLKEASIRVVGQGLFGAKRGHVVYHSEPFSSKVQVNIDLFPALAEKSFAWSHFGNSGVIVFQRYLKK